MRTDLRLLKKLLLADNSGLILEQFEGRRRVFERRVRKARSRPSEKAIHNLRIASRRMLSMLALLEVVVTPRRTKELRRKVRRRLRGLRGMRDVHVQVLGAEKLLASFPQLAGFHKSLVREERRLASLVGTQLREFDLGDLRSETDRVMDRVIASLDPEADRTLGEKLEDSIQEAFGHVLALRAHIDPQRPSTIHRMRLAFKEFRYMAEIAAPIFGQLDRERLQAMHEYQTRMGEIQDTESLLSAMRDYRRRSGRTSMLVVENEVRHQRRRLIEDFLKTADEVRFFWSTSSVESREVG